MPIVNIVFDRIGRHRVNISSGLRTDTMLFQEGRFDVSAKYSSVSVPAKRTPIDPATKGLMI
jgi:hypothetical protein